MAVPELIALRLNSKWQVSRFGRNSCAGKITLFGYEYETSGYNLPGIAQSGKGRDKTSGLRVTAGIFTRSRDPRQAGVDEFGTEDPHRLVKGYTQVVEIEEAVGERPVQLVNSLFHNEQQLTPSETGGVCKITTWNQFFWPTNEPHHRRIVERTAAFDIQTDPANRRSARYNSSSNFIGVTD
jgi:hypothetical protein